MRDLVDIIEDPETPANPRCWTLICRADAIPYDRGIAALVYDEPIAVFRLTATSGTRIGTDEWYAVSHCDPVVGVPIIARGLVGSYGDGLEIPTVASPLDKRRYDLRTGACIDDDKYTLETYAVLVTDGWLMVA